MISSLLRTNTLEALNTTQGKALVAGEPFDDKCVDRLNVLWAYLASNTMPRRINNAAGREAAINTAFIEAYFSNYIEGTHFLIEEAEEMVFEGKIPEARPKDSHDVLSTFRQLSDISGLRRLPSNADDFVSALKARHKLLMGARSEDLPGQFKPTRNKAGNTVFVEPHLVIGTLKQGYKLLQGLREPFARAVFVHFLVSDVHPFLDGNGRVSRIMMTSELEAGGLSRVVIPTVFRNEYLNGQRSMTRFSDPAANFRAIDKAQEITAKITEDDRADFLNLWASTYAFVEEGEHARLELPDPDREIHWKDGIPAPSRYWRDMDGGTSFVP
jgi:fido (protein-threonine AMPylation protein)